MAGDITPDKPVNPNQHYPELNRAAGLGTAVLSDFKPHKDASLSIDPQGTMRFGSAFDPTDQDPSKTHPKESSSSLKESIENQRNQSAYNALNAPVKPAPDGSVTSSVEAQAQQLAKLAIDAQKGLGVEGSNRAADLKKMSDLVNQLKDPDAVLDETNRLLDKDNLKIAADSKGEIYEGARANANSPYYVEVGLKTDPALDANSKALRQSAPQMTPNQR